MREWKKIAALTLVSAAVITGCAAQKGSGSAVKHTSSSDESSDPVTFVFYNADGVSDPWTDPVAKKITEATGVTLQTEFPSDGDSHSVDLMIADDGTTTYAPGSESEREYFRWLNCMYHEGILDPDFATQTHDDYMKKIADGRVLGLLDADWDYSDSEMKLKDLDEYDRTYAGLPVTISDDVTCRIAYRQGLAAGWGIGITKACKDPVRAIKFLDWMCSDEAQVLTHWGIEGVNYYVDDNGKRCRTDEEIKNSENDAGYRAETGVGFHTYPFPSYGEGVEDSTGNTYQLINRDSVISSYNVEQKAALKAWGVDMLTDIFPQDDSSEEPTHAPGGEITLGTELSELKNTLDEIARQGLINCILCDESDFDAQYNKLETDLANAGAEKAGEMMTETVQSEMKLWEK